VVLTQTLDQNANQSHPWTVGADYRTGVLNPGLAFKIAAAFGLAVARDAGFGGRDKPARVKLVDIDRRQGGRSAHLGPG
jgi:hypothetical protein